MSAWQIVFVSLLIISIFLWAAYKIPVRLVRQYSFKNQSDRVALEDSYRKTFAQILGGTALIATFSYTLFKDSVTLDQARSQFSLQQFIESSKLLKEESTGTRTAGTYALEQVAAIRSEFHVPVVNTLISFIRTRKIPDQPTLKVRPPRILADAQAALFVLARRNVSNDEGNLDLFEAYLTGASFILDPRKEKIDGFRGANFQGAKLYGVNMQGLDLTEALFNGARMADWEAYGQGWNSNTPKDQDYRDDRSSFIANFQGAQLAKAKFDSAAMGGANFQTADLKSVHFWKSDLSRANFIAAKNLSSDVTIVGARLWDACFTNIDAAKIVISISDATGADFTGANLQEANFSGTNLDSADFSAAKLNGANFSGTSLVGTNFTNTDLSNANFAGSDLSNAILDGACRSGPALPNAVGLNELPPCSNHDRPIPTRSLENSACQPYC